MKQQERLLCSLNSSLCLNYLYGVLMAAGVLAALFVAALVAAAHSSECYSYDKKHFLHKFNCFFLLIKLYFTIFFVFLRKTVQNYKLFCTYPKKIVILRNKSYIL